MPGASWRIPVSDTRVNLLDYSPQALEALMVQWQDKPFRARQLLRWVHQRSTDDFSVMTDLAKDFRARLSDRAEIRSPAVVSEQASSDGTCKWLLDVGQGNAIETVFIPEDDRGTLCISTQAGCTVACRFCSTGHQGFNRNLAVGEIIGQLWWAKRTLESGRFAARVGGGQLAPEERAISNVVMMGMGEPLLNYENTVAAMRLMLDDNAYGLSRRRVTLSTSGVVPMMDRLAKDCPVALAVSLHAPNDALRDELVPLNRKYPIRELLAACERYLPHAPRDFVMFEYVMLDGVNDSEAHAKQLIDIAKQLPCKINLIPFNPFPQSGLHRSSNNRVRAFADQLLQAGLMVTVRKTRGDDIDAACGQLAGDVTDRTQITRRLAAQGRPVRIEVRAA